MVGGLRLSWRPRAMGEPVGKSVRRDWTDLPCTLQWLLGLVVGTIVLLFVSSTRTDLANIGHHRAQAKAASKTD